MDSLFSVIDLSKIGLMLEKAKVEIHSSNIANVHNSQYLAKTVNFEKLIGKLDSLDQQSQLNTEFTIDVQDISDDNISGKINLDQEVAGMTDAELRYQTISQAIQRKFGLMDLVIGGKK